MVNWFGMSLRPFVFASLALVAGLVAMPVQAATAPKIQKMTLSSNVTRNIPAGSTFEAMKPCGGNVYLEWSNAKKKQYLVQVFQGTKEKVHVVDTQWVESPNRSYAASCIGDRYYLEITKPVTNEADYRYPTGSSTTMTTMYGLTMTSKMLLNALPDAEPSMDADYVETVDGVKQYPGFLWVDGTPSKREISGSSEITVFSQGMQKKYSPPWFKNLLTAYHPSQEATVLYYRLAKGFRVYEWVMTPKAEQPGVTEEMAAFWDQTLSVYEIQDGESQYTLVDGTMKACPVKEVRSLSTKEDGRALMLDVSRFVPAPPQNIAGTFMCQEAGTGQQAWNLHLLTPNSGRTYLYPSDDNSASRGQFFYLVKEKSGKSALWSANVLTK